MKRLVLSAVVAVALTGIATAQLHRHGYACGGINFTKTTLDATVFLVDTNGKFLHSVPTGANNVHGLVMDHNNQLLMATNLDGKIYKVDPATGTMVGTLTDFGVNYSLRDITVGQNGNYYVTESLQNDAVFKVDVLGAITTVAILGDNPGGGIEIDIDSSQLLVQSQNSPDPLRLISRDGSSITTVATGFNARWGITQHIPSGAIYSSSCCGSNNLGNIYWVLPPRSTATIWLNGVTQPDGVYSLRADRASAATQQMILGGCWLSCLPNVIGGLYRIDIFSKSMSPVTTMFTNQTDIYEVEFLYRRNVHSNLTGKGQWDVDVHIPEDATKPFILAVSALGIRPGIKVPSGRTIPVIPDAFTVASIAGGLAPFFAGNVGLLDSTGRARAKLDLSFIGPPANGIKLWFLAATLDHQAPDGIRTITDPHVIQIEGL